VNAFESTLTLMKKETDELILVSGILDSMSNYAYKVHANFMQTEVEML
jgi:hypothetical protein